MFHRAWVSSKKPFRVLRGQRPRWDPSSCVSTRRLIEKRRRRSSDVQTGPRPMDFEFSSKLSLTQEKRRWR